MNFKCVNGLIQEQKNICKDCNLWDGCPLRSSEGSGIACYILIAEAIIFLGMLVVLIINANKGF